MSIGDRILHLVTRPGEELGRLARFVQFQIRLWRFCAARLHSNNLPAMAAALSFRTIFALIPILVLAFLVAGALGAIDDSKESLRAFLHASGFSRISVIPETQPATPTAPTSAPEAETINMANEIITLVERVESKLTLQRIGPIGAALLIWTALSLLSTMEESLNRVFGAARSRSTVRRVLLYWSAMTLGPIVLALAIFVSQHAMLTASEIPLLSALVKLVVWIGPVLVGILALAATYILLPNTFVNRRAALGAATVVVFLWLLARWAFAAYVQRFVLEGNLYGILGVIPLFLMWLNLSWLIFLFGAEMAHTAANIRRLDLPEEAEPQIVTPDDALAIVLCVLREYTSGGGAADPATISGCVTARAEAVQWLIERLVERNILYRVTDRNGQRYLPARPSDKIAVAEILDVCATRIERPAERETQNGIPDIVAHVRARMHAGLRDLTLAELNSQDARS